MLLQSLEFMELANAWGYDTAELHVWQVSTSSHKKQTQKGGQQILLYKQTSSFHVFANWTSIYNFQEIST